MPWKDSGRRIETDIKSDMMKYINKFYPSAHAVIIPATHWRLLPYDSYAFYKGMFYAIELKVDDHPVQAHQFQALYEVVANRGYAFTFRWINASKTIVIENFTNGDAQIFKGDISDRQMMGTTRIDSEDRPFNKESCFHKALEYIFSFDVSPLEEQVQKIIQRDYKKRIEEKLKGIRT